MMDKQQGLEFLTPDGVTPAPAPKIPRKGRQPTIPKVPPTDPNKRLNLPDPEEWRSFFPPQKYRDRISVSNPDTAARLADAFVPAGSRDKVVIEAFPGESAFLFAW